MSYMAVLALVSLPDSLPDEVSRRSRYTWNEDGAARESDRLVDRTSGGRTTRKRVAPCCWALARRGDISDPDVPEPSRDRETVNAELRGEVASLKKPRRGAQ